ncbi:MAG: DUF2924 domain-containing protein [Acidobacteriia bacterium]|nr:DUF2924 domain-containing protein [Terriglobia bacterium]
MEGSVIREIQRLRAMSVGELREEWRRLHGEDCRSKSKDFLYRRLCWKTQELAYGGLSAAAKTRIAELAPDTFVRARVPIGLAPPAVEPALVEEPPLTRRDPRLPSPGTVISRQYHGRELRLLVLDDGYELEGVRYASLTEAAKAATGSHWNGKLYWGVTQRKRKS